MWFAANLVKKKKKKNDFSPNYRQQTAIIFKNPSYNDPLQECTMKAIEYYSHHRTPCISLPSYRLPGVHASRSLRKTRVGGFCWYEADGHRLRVVTGMRKKPMLFIYLCSTTADAMDHVEVGVKVPDVTI